MSEKSYHVENKQLFKKTIEVKLYNKILNLEDQQMEGSCEYKRLVKNFKYNQKVNFKKP